MNRLNWNVRFLKLNLQKNLAWQYSYLGADNKIK